MLQDTILRGLNNSWARTLVLLVMLMVLANQISLLFWQLYPVANTALELPKQIVMSEISDARSRGALEQSRIIGSAHLFGEVQTEVLAVVEVEDAPETRLNYKLRGIFYSEVTRLSSALIEIKTNDTKHYRLDDEIAENISVATIKRDHILINRYGKIERLNLEKSTRGGNSAFINTRLANPNAIANTALLRSYKKRYVSNPLALAKRFQAIPVQQNGQNIGFKLKALRGESLLKRLGFKESDIFVEINGIGLGKPFQALDALKSLTTASSVSVTILRDGNKETMNFGM